MLSAERISCCAIDEGDDDVGRTGGSTCNDEADDWCR